MSTPTLTPAIASLLEGLLEQIQHSQSCAGCNDCEVPNTPEIWGLWKEYNIWNSGTEDESEWIPFPSSEKPTVVVHDGFLMFLLRKHLGLLSRS
jgi:hypothetical protein